jgi:hypothetical protein
MDRNGSVALDIFEESSDGVLTDRGLVSQSASRRELTAARVGYTVGGSLVTLAHLRAMLVPLTAPGACTRPTPCGVPVSTSSDPRALFLLASAYKLSPAIQVTASVAL